MADPVEAALPQLHRGMPPLDTSGRPFSRFERLNPFLFYAPVMLYAMTLFVRYRSITLPSLANPLIPSGGAVGERKSDVFKLAGPYARHLIAPYVTFPVNGALEARVEKARRAISEASLAYPLVAKPDSGLRGAGVQPVENEAALKAYLEAFPAGRELMLQEKVEHEAEAGIFYVRHPEEAQGRIISITLKYTPYLIGDGEASVAELIARDRRASELGELYRARYADKLDYIPAPGEPFRLVFAANHCRGAIFRDGTALATPEMTAAFDRVAKDIAAFHFGRFDVRFTDIADLRRGSGFKIVEINGVGSEATHIWDRSMTLRKAYGALFEQWRLAFEIGAANKNKGFRPIGVWRVFKDWVTELRRDADYPPTA